MTAAFRGFQLSRTAENREAYRRALREARLEEKPWLVPLKGSNETEYRERSNVRAAKNHRSRKRHFQRFHVTNQASLVLVQTNLSREDGVKLPDKVHLRTEDRVETASGMSAPLREAAPGQIRSLADLFISLPPELRLMILEKLYFGDIDRLRRTCRSFRAAIDKSTVKAVFPDISEVLSTTCRHCLGTDQSARLIIKERFNHPLQPLGNVCWRCASKRKEYQVGKQYHMVGETRAYFCRWCGFPTTREVRPGQTSSQYHKDCYRIRIKAISCYVLAGILQCSALFIASGMCWAHFHEYAAVTGTTIPGFFVSIWIFLLIVIRQPRFRTFHWAFMLELVILALWVPPIYTLVKLIRDRTGKPAHVKVETLGMIGINVIMHLLNAIGYAALTCEYKPWQRKRPGRTTFQRILSSCLFIIVLWTWGQSMNLEYPPQWWFTEIRMERRRRPFFVGFV